MITRFRQYIWQLPVPELPLVTCPWLLPPPDGPARCFRPPRPAGPPDFEPLESRRLFTTSLGATCSD